MKEKELRLALVCYGGISLAIYMHGITKEIWHLARASRAFHDGSQPANGSERVYADMLREIEAASGIRLRIMPDIIAGASAGGINGIFLAQAIETGDGEEEDATIPTIGPRCDTARRGGVRRRKSAEVRQP